MELYNFVAVSACGGILSIHVGANPGVLLVMGADAWSLLVANLCGGMTATWCGGLLGLAAGLSVAVMMGLR